MILPSTYYKPKKCYLKTIPLPFDKAVMSVFITCPLTYKVLSHNSYTVFSKKAI